MATALANLNQGPTIDWDIGVQNCFLDTENGDKNKK
jgi:hypothetical protein